MNVVQFILGVIIVGVSTVFVGIAWMFNFIAFLFASLSDLCERLLVSLLPKGL